MTPDEIKKINEARETNVNAGRSAYSGTGATPFSTSQGLGTITSDSLGGNATLYNIPSPILATSAEGLSGFVTSYAEQQKSANQSQADLQNQLALAKTKAESEKSSARKALEGTFQSVTDLFSTRPQLEQDAGLDKKAQRVTDVTNQIEASERAKVNELRALESANLTDAGRATAARDINRKYAFEQADFALIQSAANRDYETASNIINRKIELQLEPLKLKLDFQKFFYEDNKDLFNKAEQRQFESLTKATEREYEDAKTLEKYKADVQLEAVKNGVQIPSYVLSELNRATNQSEVAQVLARNGISLENQLDAENRRLQNLKLRREIENLSGTGQPIVLQANTLNDAKSGLFQFTQSEKIPASVREQIRKGIVLINKLNEMVAENPEGNFAGGRLRATLAPFLPGSVEPRFQKLKADEAKIRQDLVTYITGAAYTSLQEGDVNKIIPRSQLFDSQNQERVNNLANTVLGDIEAALISSGVNAQLPRFDDLFTSQLISELSPEQEAELRAEGLIQ